jgi:hypothetical protein
VTYSKPASIRALISSGVFATLHETLFEDAAVFLTIFYKLLIGEKSSPWIAFRNAIAGASSSLPQLSGAWGFYEWGKKFLV